MTELRSGKKRQKQNISDSNLISFNVMILYEGVRIKIEPPKFWQFIFEDRQDLYAPDIIHFR